ncbi:hypothetical protein HDU86_002354 [Geranomyces michiganensis]|nr:hypothetical protein HDU86_002354 [Geranomyces michiganensis]
MTREDRLTEGLIGSRHSLIEGYELFARDWQPDSLPGEGDLVFYNEDEQRFLIVEVKALHDGQGRTARASRNQARKKVDEQVKLYTNLWASKYPKHKISGTSFVGFMLEDATFGETYYPDTPGGRRAQKADQSTVLTQPYALLQREDETGAVGNGTKAVLAVGAFALAAIAFGKLMNDDRHH